MSFDASFCNNDLIVTTRFDAGFCNFRHLVLCNSHLIVTTMFDASFCNSHLIVTTRFMLVNSHLMSPLVFVIYCHH